MPRLASALLSLAAGAAVALRVTPAQPAAPEHYRVECADTYQRAGGLAAGCMPTSATAAGCARHLEDAFVSPAEVSSLLEMLEPVFARSKATAGPTILDVNTGFMRDSATGTVNIYRRAADQRGAAVAPVTFSAAHLALYRGVFERIRARVRELWNLTTLYFTAPTFVTRIIGHTEDVVLEPHDEYFHSHVDMANTAHYHWAGLLYLSTHASADEQAGEAADGGGVAAGPRFAGGAFAFLKQRNASLRAQGGAGDEAASLSSEEEHVVYPRAGRLLLFSAGHENEHVVRRVTAGVRYVFSMWFTCDPAREFKTLLDNRAHEIGGVKAAKQGDDGAARPSSKKRKWRRPSKKRTPTPSPSDDGGGVGGDGDRGEL